MNTYRAKFPGPLGEKNSPYGVKWGLISGGGLFLGLTKYKPMITVSSRFCGPPTSGNGGYSCGMVDKQTDYVSEVTLRKPIPLDREMDVQKDGDQLRLMAGEELIATARPSSLDDFEVPPYLDFADALKSSKNFLGYQERPAFPTCFVCGIDRAEGDGLRIFAGASEQESPDQRRSGCSAVAPAAVAAPGKWTEVVAGDTG